MEVGNKTKTRVIVKKKMLKDGTMKKYEYTAKYNVKGNIAEDGTVTKFTTEQKAEMKRLRETGVTIRRIAQDFNTSVTTISKIINE